MRVTLCVLCGNERNGWLNSGLVGRLLEAHRAQTANVDVTFCENIFPVTAARNLCCSRALQDGADWLVMCDNDQHPPQNFVERVLADINERPEISIAVLPSWMFRDTSVVLNVVEAQGSEIFKPDGHYTMPTKMHPGWREIALGGAGIIFIRTSVLKRMPGPWFRLSERATVAQRMGVPSGPSEDFDFIYRARTAGFRAFANSEYLADHFHTVSLDAWGRSRMEQIL